MAQILTGERNPLCDQCSHRCIPNAQRAVERIGDCRLLNELPQPPSTANEWQANVSRFVREAQLIVMLAGRTPGVIWALQQILAHGRTAELVVLLPEIASSPADLAARVAQLRDTFRGTSWEEELHHFDDYSDVKAMLFRSDGSMMMVNSHSRSREAYHLAAILGHWIARRHLAPWSSPP